MVQKIVSGGQTGVDRAALDVALRLGVPCAGWCPKGRLAEDGRLPRRYPLEETPDPDYVQRTSWNVRDSDGTLVLTWGPPTDGTAYTIVVAKQYCKPYFVVDLFEPNEMRDVQNWLESNRIRTMNVAGPRASKCPGIYEDAASFLECLLGTERP